jgi:hypothetical protein
MEKSEAEPAMTTKRYVYWRDGSTWLGFLEDYPDCWTQGASIDELSENLQNLYRDLSSGAVPAVPGTAEQEIP